MRTFPLKVLKGIPQWESLMCYLWGFLRDSLWASLRDTLSEFIRNPIHTPLRIALWRTPGRGISSGVLRNQPWNSLRNVPLGILQDPPFGIREDLPLGSLKGFPLGSLRNSLGNPQGICLHILRETPFANCQRLRSWESTKKSPLGTLKDSSREILDMAWDFRARVRIEYPCPL